MADMSHGIRSRDIHGHYLMLKETQVDLIHVAGGKLTFFNHLTTGFGITTTIGERYVLFIGEIEVSLFHTRPMNPFLTATQQKQLSILHLGTQAQDATNAMINWICRHEEC